MYQRGGKDLVEKLRNMGVIIGDKTPEQFDRFLRDYAMLVFHKESRKGRLSLVFYYQMSEQKAPYNGNLGMCFRFNDGRHAIGISYETIERGEEYSLTTLIHEFAHLEYIDHSPQFYEHANRLTGRLAIMRFPELRKCFGLPLW